MPKSYFLILNDPVVRLALKQAWDESKPGETGGHEEGGFVIRSSSGDLNVIRWSRGEKDSIQLPPHPDCKVAESEIVASFHTHPNTGSGHLQEPSETDRRAVRDDADLKGEGYVGELVISLDTIYLIIPNGQVRELADTDAVFAEE